MRHVYTLQLIVDNGILLGGVCGIYDNKRAALAAMNDFGFSQHTWVPDPDTREVARLRALPDKDGKTCPFMIEVRRMPVKSKHVVGK